MASESLNLSNVSSEGRLRGPIRVKLMRIWEINPTTVPHSIGSWICLILSDEEGTKIDMEITRKFMYCYYSKLFKESRWFNLSNVDVTTNYEVCKNTKHGFALHATGETSMDEIPSPNSNHYLDMVDLRDIIDRSIDSDIPICTVGVIRTFRDLEVYPINPLHSSFIFEMKDDRAREIQCYASGDCALDFQRQWHQSPIGIVVCVLRYWMIKRSGDDVWLSSRTGVSDVIFNPDYPEVREMKRRLPFTDL